MERSRAGARGARLEAPTSPTRSTKTYRWDYIFTLRRQGFEDQKRSFVVCCSTMTQVQKIDAPVLPSEDEFVAAISRKKLPTSTPKLELTDAERAALPAPVAVAADPAASAVVLAGATRSYPPLEPPAQ